MRTSALTARGRWEIAPRLPQSRFDRFPGVERLLIQILDNRGVGDDAEVESFLAGPRGATADPMLLKGMPEAVERIGAAIRRGELIAVYGDFDADGVTSTVLAVEALEALGARVIPFIPQRDDGYGLNLRAIESLAERGVTLVVTVDCGVSSAGEVDAARRLGLDVVVTDHHQVTGPVPDAVAVVNPRQADCPYPFKWLAGVGVALKLAQALLGSLSVVDGRDAGEVERSLLDLVAIGTVTDVVPLLGENRVLAGRGLVELNRTGRPGLRELVELAGLRLGALGSWDIGYLLGPRLNAAGRMGDASASYDLLVGGADEAGDLAAGLDAANRERQLLTEEALGRARESVARQDPEANLLFVAGSGYPHGILGLVAGRLVEESYRPSFVLSVDGEEARGSVRSIAEFDVAEALAECRDLLLRFGGHPRAAGFSVHRSNLEALRDRLEALAASRLADLDLRPTLLVDAELNLRGVNSRLYQEIQRLAPFGHENPAPLFLSRGLRVLDARVVGQTQPGHLKLALHDGVRRWSAIGFGLGGLISEVGGLIDAVYSLEQDNWGGRQSLQLHLKAFQQAGA